MATDVRQGPPTEGEERLIAYLSDAIERRIGGARVTDDLRSDLLLVWRIENASLRRRLASALRRAGRWERAARESRGGPNAI